MEGSSGYQMAMAGLNKNTKKDFVQRPKGSPLLKSSNVDYDDPDYIPDASGDSMSDLEDNEGRINCNNLDGVQEGQLFNVAGQLVIPKQSNCNENDVGLHLIYEHENDNQPSNEDIDLFELQPLRVDLTESNNGREYDITEPTKNETHVDTNGHQKDIQYTKKDTIRKRKKYNMPLEERKKKKFDSVAQMHNVEVGCDDSCAQKCTTKISEDREISLMQNSGKLLTQPQENLL